MSADPNGSTKIDLAAVETEARQLLLAGDAEQAREVLQEARVRCQQAQDTASLGIVLRLLGDLEWSLGRHEPALRSYEQAQAQFRRAERREDEADALLSIGDARARLGLAVGAQEAFQTSAKIYESLDRPLFLAHCHYKLGTLAWKTNPTVAEQHFVRAEELYDQVQKLDAYSMFRVENPPLPETVEDCRVIEPWIMLEVVRRDLAILRGQVEEPRKKRTPRKTEPAVATVAAPAKSQNRDLIVSGTILLVVTALFGLLILGVKVVSPGLLPFGKVPFFVLGLLASGLSALALRSSEIESKALSGVVPLVVGCVVFFGSAMAFETASDAATESLLTEFAEAEIGEASEIDAADARRLELEKLLASYEKAGDRRGEADTLVQLALLEREQNRSTRALELFSRSYGLFQVLGATDAAGGVALSMGDILRAANRSADARAQYLEGAALFAKQGDTSKRADALMRAGDIERSMGRAEEARKLYMEAFTLVAPSTDLSAQVEALLRLAQIEQDAKRLLEARKIYQKALGVAQKSNDAALQSSAWLALGELESDAGDVESAQTAMKRSAELAAEAGDPMREVMIWQRLGKLERATNKLTQASESFRQALKAAERSNDREEQATTLLLLAELDSETGNLGNARSRFTQAMAIYADRGKDTGRGDAALGLGDLEVKQGRSMEARDTYRLALRFYEVGGSMNGQIAALERLSKVLASIDPTRAKSYAAKASQLRERL